MYEPTDETKEFAERDQLIKSILALKAELIGQLNKIYLSLSIPAKVLMKLLKCYKGKNTPNYDVFSIVLAEIFNKPKKPLN